MSTSRIRQYLVPPDDIARLAPAERPQIPTGRPTLGGVLFATFFVVAPLLTVAYDALGGKYWAMLGAIAPLALACVLFPRSMVRLLNRWRYAGRAAAGR